MKRFGVEVHNLATVTLGEDALDTLDELLFCSVTSVTHEGSSQHFGRLSR